MQYDVEIELLEKRLSYLKEKKKQYSTNLSTTISEEISDDNPYSRLFALQKLGIVTDYKKIRDFTAVIVGVGGVGSVAADMLTRIGIGKIILIDFDIVTLANMNRLFYQPFQQGQYKVDAARTTLLSINPDVIIETYKQNICTVENYPKFLKLLQSSSIKQTQVDVVLCCVDNFDGRLTVNRACVDLNIPMFESGVGEDAQSCHVQFVNSGFACYECSPPLVTVDSSLVKPLKREGVCAASLPTTMTLVASIMVHSVLKFLLQFGEIHSYISCNAYSDFFQVFNMKANPECTVQSCRQRNETYKKTPKPNILQDIPKETISKENEWGIELVLDNLPQTSHVPSTIQVDTNTSLESLIKQYTSL